jgi:hypothetical protein
MKQAALALDYDGTIAVDGILDSAVRDAIATARQQGILVIHAWIRPSEVSCRSKGRSRRARKT